MVQDVRKSYIELVQEWEKTDSVAFAFKSERLVTGKGAEYGLEEKWTAVL